MPIQDTQNPPLAELKLDADFSQLLNTMSRAGYATPEELHHYSKRLELLVKEADLEDEPISCDSFINLAQFMADVSAERSLRPGTLSLMANGDFRIEWGSPQKEFVGLRFMASGEFKCVLLKKRGGRQHQAVHIQQLA